MLADQDLVNSMSEDYIVPLLHKSSDSRDSRMSNGRRSASSGSLTKTPNGAVDTSVVPDQRKGCVTLDRKNSIQLTIDIILLIVCK